MGCIVFVIPVWKPAPIGDELGHNTKPAAVFYQSKQTLPVCSGLGKVFHGFSTRHKIVRPFKNARLVSIQRVIVLNLKAPLSHEQRENGLRPRAEIQAYTAWREQWHKDIKQPV